MYMYKPLWRSLAFLFFLNIGTWALAQNFHLMGRPAQLPDRKILDAKFRDYQLYQLDVASLSAYLRADAKAKPVRLSVGSHDWRLIVRDNDVRHAAYRTLIGTDKGVLTAPEGKNVTYTARFEQSPAIVSALTVDTDFLDGYVKEGDEFWFIEPARLFEKNAPADVFVVYNLKNVQPFEAKCASDYMGGSAVFDQNQTPTQAVLQSSTCKQVALGVAADADLYMAQNNSTETVKNIVFSIINYINVNYFTSTFTDQIKFTITVFYIATNSSADPYSPNTSSTVANDLLANFRTWGLAGNFGVPFDLGMVYTARDISSTVVGLAYRPGSCGVDSYLFQIDEYRNYPIAGMASVVAHETGHNFNACHDGDSGCSCTTAGTFVMSPTVNFSAPATAWSSCSVTTINAHYSSLSCITNCATLGAPVSDFYTANTMACTNTNIPFSDVSTNDPTTWSWSFPGGSPSSSSAQSPSTQWATPGQYDVSMTASNSAGTTNTAYKFGYVRILAAPSTACTPSGSSSSAAGITYFNLNTIAYTSGNSAAEGNYSDFACAQFTTLLPNTSYQARVDLPVFAAVKVWIDYNDNGSFSDPGELAFASPDGFVYSGAYQFSFTTSATPLTNRFLRLRVRAYGTPFNSDPCAIYDSQTGQTGQTEDYAVFFDTVLPVELSAFSAKKTEKSQVSVDWTTASETQNVGFEVQRSMDGRSFETIGKVAGKMASNTTQVYQYIDEKPFIGHNYYRLKQVDVTGRENLSSVAYVWIDPEKGHLEVYPNPAHDVLRVRFEKADNLLIINTLGQIVKTVAVEDLPQAQDVSVPIADLEAGVYILKATIGQTSKVVRFVKK